MATNNLAYIYQLQNQNYKSISSLNFKVGVFDPDDAQLTTAQLGTLEAAGKSVIAYLSIGEAETYRSYWTSSWNSNPPSFVLGENPDWPGNFTVKFWDPAWQKIIIDRAVALAKSGYDGLTLDVVDVYSVGAVAGAYSGSSNPRAEMMKFVTAISNATKAINPDFKIIQNNALDLLTTNPNNPASGANTAYLKAIDGVNAESTFFLPSNQPTSWGAWNLQYLDTAVAAGKTVFAIDYPTSSSAQQSFLSQALAHDFVPLVGDQKLASIPAVNYQVPGMLPADALDDFLADGGPVTPAPEPAPTPVADHQILGTSSANNLNGIATRDLIYAKGGNDTVHGNGGNDYVQGDGGSDLIYGDDGNDALFGNADNDRIYGGNGQDYMEGNGGADFLDGGSSNDVLWGGDGADTIIGNSGNDDLYGNAGNDKFLFQKGAGQDVINDFQNPGKAAGDVIQISSQIYTSVSQVLSHITYANGDAVIHLDGTNSITVAGVPNHALTASDFQIV